VIIKKCNKQENSRILMIIEMRSRNYFTTLCSILAITTSNESKMSTEFHILEKIAINAYNDISFVNVFSLIIGG